MSDGIDETMLPDLVEKYGADKPVLVVFMYLSPKGSRDVWVAYDTQLRQVIAEGRSLAFIKNMMACLGYNPKDVRILTSVGVDD
jgi:hypothetical protein